MSELGTAAGVSAANGNGSVRPRLLEFSNEGLGAITAANPMVTIATMLEAKIPRDVITQRTASGKTFDYLTGHYVIARLNEVIGHGNWGYSSEVQQLFSGILNEGTDKATHYTSYTARVKLVVRFPNGNQCEYSDYGFGDGQDKYNPGKVFELAIKEAITDGLKRCARVLGNSMGNGLYDKTGEGIDEESAKVSDKPSSRKSAKKDTQAPGAEAPKLARGKLNEIISATSRVVVSKGLMSVDEIRADMKTKYGVDDKAALTDDQATEFRTFLETTAKGNK